MPQCEKKERKKKITFRHTCFLPTEASNTCRGTASEKEGVQVLYLEVLEICARACNSASKVAGLRHQCSRFAKVTRIHADCVRACTAHVHARYSAHTTLGLQHAICAGCFGMKVGETQRWLSNDLRSQVLVARASLPATAHMRKLRAVDTGRPLASSAHEISIGTAQNWYCTEVSAGTDDGRTHQLHAGHAWRLTSLR